MFLLLIIWFNSLNDRIVLGILLLSQSGVMTTRNESAQHVISRLQ